MASTHITTNTPIDPILRFLQALDDNDATLFRSAFTQDVELDQSGLSAVTGQPMPTVNGIDATEQAMLVQGVGATMDTGHIAGNFRVWPKDGEAGTLIVSAYVVGTHKRKGEGLNPGKEAFTAQSRWTAEVVQEQGRWYTPGVVQEAKEWRIKKVGLKMLWTGGDFGVMMPAGAGQ